MKPKAFMAALAAIAVTSLVACSSEEPSKGSQGSQVAATLDDYSIETSVRSVPAGTVTFKVDNVGATEHEMVVIRTDLDPAAIPVEDHEANEEAPGMTPIGEVEEVQPGESTELELSLEPGTYLLICNIRKHFERGMVSKFRVA